MERVRHPKHLKNKGGLLINEGDKQQSKQTARDVRVYSSFVKGKM